MSTRYDARVETVEKGEHVCSFSALRGPTLRRELISAARRSPGPLSVRVTSEDPEEADEHLILTRAEDGSAVFGLEESVLLLGPGVLPAFPVAFPSAAFPSAAFLLDREGEGWLREELISLLGLGPYGHIAAIGMWLRLGPEASMSTEDMLAGKPAPEDPDVAGWFAALRALSARARALHLRNAAMGSTFGCFVVGPFPPSRQEVRDARRCRDEAEGVREVIWRVDRGMGARFDEHLRHGDESLRKRLRRSHSWAGPRLRLAASRFPEAWWAVEIDRRS